MSTMWIWGIRIWRCPPGTYLGGWGLLQPSCGKVALGLPPTVEIIIWDLEILSWFFFVMFSGMCLGILQIMMALGPFSRWSVCACKPPRRRARGNRCPPPAFIIPLSTSPSGALDQDLGIATLKDSNESSLRVLSKISGAIYLRVPTLSNKCFFPNPSHNRHNLSTIKKDNHLVFGEISRELFSSRYLTARPKSAITAVPSFLKHDEMRIRTNWLNILSRSYLTRMFLDLMSRWAIAGLPRLPEISVCRWLTPQAIEWVNLVGVMRMGRRRMGNKKSRTRRKVGMNMRMERIQWLLRGWEGWK